MEYPIIIFDNHIIVHIDNHKVLIDTGSPVSIGNIDSLLINEKRYPLGKDFQGLNVQELSDLVGTSIDVLLGVDVLCSNFYVDWEQKIVTFFQTPDFQGKIIPIDTLINIPILEVEVEGEKVRTFLDTGAKMCYFSSYFTNNYKSQSTIEDFYPGIGKFETAVYQIPVTIGREQLNLLSGNLPKVLQQLLLMANAQGIVGNVLFEYYPKIYYDFINKVIKVGKERGVSSEKKRQGY